MYALVLEADGCEFLMDPAMLWKPPRVIVRKGYLEAEVWLDETDVWMTFGVAGWSVTCWLISSRA